MHDMRAKGHRDVVEEEQARLIGIFKRWQQGKAEMRDYGIHECVARLVGEFVDRFQLCPSPCPPDGTRIRRNELLVLSSLVKLLAPRTPVPPASREASRALESSVSGELATLRLGFPIFVPGRVCL